MYFGYVKGIWEIVFGADPFQTTLMFFHCELLFWWSVNIKNPKPQ